MNVVEHRQETLKVPDSDSWKSDFIDGYRSVRNHAQDRAVMATVQEVLETPSNYKFRIDELKTLQRGSKKSAAYCKGVAIAFNVLRLLRKDAEKQSNTKKGVVNEDR